MEKAMEIGIELLNDNKYKINDAVMFDIDDTLIFYDEKPNYPIIQLAQYARERGYKIVIITARPDYPRNRIYTQMELSMYEIPYDLIIYSSHENKPLIKQKLSSEFILSVGDLWTDVTDSKHYIKLPSRYKNDNIIVIE